MLVEWVTANISLGMGGKQSVEDMEIVATFHLITVYFAENNGVNLRRMGVISQIFLIHFIYEQTIFPEIHSANRNGCCHEYGGTGGSI